MPKVSIIIPCFNEEKTITQLLEAIRGQKFSPQDLEVVIADGNSTDSTPARIEEFKGKNSELPVRVIENSTQKIPAGLNLAILEAKGKYILRLDAHCVPYPDYVGHCIDALEAGKGWNVGGIWEVKPGNESWIARSIAVAAAHPLGVGDALYRFTERAGEVDTVPFGAFERGLIGKIGSFDETLEANEDYEFNARIRQAGGKVWLDPTIRSIYYSRPDLLSLARQYVRYGYWKVRMLRRYPKTIRLRQAIPPLFVLSLLVLPLASLLWEPFSWVLKAEVVSYALLLFGVGIQKALQLKQLFLAVGVPLAMITMHLSWGAAFLWSLISSPKANKTQTNG